MSVLSLTPEFIQWVLSIAQTWGYLGLFLINVIGNATLFFPFPAFAFVFVFGSVLNPWLVGIISGIGAAIGELVGYVVGRGGNHILKKKNKKWFDKALKWSEKRGVFPVIIVFAATPIPYDIIGILCGIIKYDLRKFFLATLIGKIIINTALAWAGFYSLTWVISTLGLV